MIYFILKRLGYGFLVIFGVVVVIFTLFYVLPGDPTATILGDRSDEATKKAIIENLGLDKPITTQFFYYLNDLSPLAIHSDNPETQKEYNYAKVISFGTYALTLKYPYLGRSFSVQKDKLVSEILAEDIIGTIILALVAMFFATMFGVLFGIVSAIKQNTWVDYSLVTLSVLGISTPSFVLAIIVSVTFGFYLKDYTGLHLTGTLWKYNPYTESYELQLRNLILPAFTLALRPLAIIVQLTRSSMIDVLSQDYIRTARAKGLGFYKTIYKHALKNALNPVITAVSGWLASLMAGAFFIEYIFSWKGLGKTTIQAVQQSDLPIVMGAAILIAVIFVVINIMVDVIYALLDPRIRLGED